MKTAVIAVCLCLCAGVWVAFHYYNTYDRQLVMDMYMGRQRTIMNYTGDVLDMALEHLQGMSIMGMPVGDYATRLIDDYISSGKITEHLEERIRGVNKPGPGESLAYGNFVLVYEGRPRYVMGYMKDEFEKSGDAVKPHNPRLERMLDAHRGQIEKSENPESLVSEVADIGGRVSMFTTGPLHIGEKTAYMTLYADQNDILDQYGHYERRGTAILCAALVTLGILAFGVVALRGLNSSVRHYDSVRAYNIALESEINERKLAHRQKDALHEQLLHSQKMEAVGTLAGGIAHDFNNLLTVIMGNAEIALMNLLPGEAPHHELSQIYKASQRARDLTMKMLTFARKEKLAEKTVPLNTIIEEELMPMLDRSLPPAIRVSTVLNRNLDPVRGDVNQLLQAFLNICTNARDAMDGSGSLTIETGDITVPEGPPGPDGLPTGRWCLARFTDNGAGMTPEILNKVCEPFFTTKPMGRGTGLGMAVTHGIITGHGGRLAISSTPGRGTSVTVYLPFARLAETAPAAKVTEPQPGATRPLALVVDDELGVVEIITEVLEQLECDTVSAADGRTALELCGAHAGRLALAIIDWHLPDMPGMDLALKIKSAQPDCDVIIMSGDSMRRPDRLQGDAPSVAVFMEKPFRIDELLALASKSLDKA